MRFCDLLGIALKPSKTEWGADLAFLGTQGDFPRPDNNVTLTVSLRTDKARRCAQ